MNPDLERTNSQEPSRLSVVQPSPLPGVVEEPPKAAQFQVDLKPQTDFLWNVHKYSNDYIRFADTKAAFTITLSSAVLGALAKSGIQKTFMNVAPQSWSGSAFLALLAFVLLAIGIGLGAWTIRPRLSTRQPKALIFWEGIREHGTPEAFWAELKAKSPEQLNEHVAHHIYGLSNVARRKYFWTAVAMSASAIGGALAACVMLLQ